MPSATTRIGLEAESATCRELTRLGYRVVDRNWRRPWGELDIVADLDGVIHFIEVKAGTARSDGFEPFLRADRAKMAKVERTARTWLAANRYGAETPWQIDIVSVIMESGGPTFEYFENI